MENFEKCAKHLQEAYQSAVLFGLGIAIVAKMCNKVKDGVIFEIMINNGFNEMQCVTVSVHLTSSNAAACIHTCSSVFPFCDLPSLFWALCSLWACVILMLLVVEVSPKTINLQHLHLHCGRSQPEDHQPKMPASSLWPKLVRRPSADDALVG